MKSDAQVGFPTRPFAVFIIKSAVTKVQLENSDKVYTVEYFIELKQKML